MPTDTKAKLLSRYSYFPSGNNLKVKKRRNFGLHTALIPGTGTIYSFEFGIGGSDSGPLSTLHYIGLTVQSPTAKRIAQHRTEAASGKYRLDYLAFNAALNNKTPGTKIISSIEQMVNVINRVSFFDLALMETYYINYVEKTRDPANGLGQTAFKGFDEVLEARGYTNKGTLKPGIKIGLNSGAGGEGDPIKQKATPEDVNSRRLTPAEVIIAAAVFLEDNDGHDEGARDVLDARSKFFPPGWDNASIEKSLDTVGVYKNKMSKDDYFAEKIRYIISWFKSQGALKEDQLEKAKRELNVPGENYKVAFSLGGVMTQFFELDLVYIKEILNAVGYNTDVKFNYTEKAGVNYNQKFNQQTADAFAVLYPKDGRENLMVPTFTSQAILSIMDSRSLPDALKLVAEFKGDPQASKEKVRLFRKEYTDGLRGGTIVQDIVEAITNEVIARLNQRLSEKNRIASMGKGQIEAMVNKEIANYKANNKTGEGPTSQQLQSMVFKAYKAYVDMVMLAAKRAGIVFVDGEEEQLRAKLMTTSYLTNKHFSISKYT